MRRPDLPFPSFALVMSKAQNFDVSRLPPYRSSLIERFHPYARVSARRPQDSLMACIFNRLVTIQPSFRRVVIDQGGLSIRGGSRRG